MKVLARNCIVLAMPTFKGKSGLSYSLPSSDYESHCPHVHVTINGEELHIRLRPDCDYKKKNVLNECGGKLLVNQQLSDEAEIIANDLDEHPFGKNSGGKLGEVLLAQYMANTTYMPIDWRIRDYYIDAYNLHFHTNPAWTKSEKEDWLRSEHKVEVDFNQNMQKIETKIPTHKTRKELKDSQ